MHAGRGCTPPLGPNGSPRVIVSSARLLVNTVGPLSPLGGLTFGPLPRSVFGVATAPKERAIPGVLDAGRNVGLDCRPDVGIGIDVFASTRGVESLPFSIERSVKSSGGVVARAVGFVFCVLGIGRFPFGESRLSGVCGVVGGFGGVVGLLSRFGGVVGLWAVWCHFRGELGGVVGDVGRGFGVVGVIAGPLSRPLGGEHLAHEHAQLSAIVVVKCHAHLSAACGLRLRVRARAPPAREGSGSCNSPTIRRGMPCPKTRPWAVLRRAPNRQLHAGGARPVTRTAASFPTPLHELLPTTDAVP